MIRKQYLTDDTIRSRAISNLWRWSCGKEEQLLEEEAHTYDSLSQTEWDPEFINLMHNRLMMGGMRYGLIGAEVKPQYDRIESAKKRLDMYVKTGNLEFLVDVANMALLEYREGVHPNKHFSAIDGDHGCRGVALPENSTAAYDKESAT